jgi:DNA-binding ferritin-like protein (Dps family)
LDIFLRLVDIIAWPFVALLALIILGPGGVLLRFTESLGSSISNFTKSLPELKSTALTLKSDVDTLVSRSRDMSEGVSKEFQEIEARIDRLSARFLEAMTDVKTIVDEIDRGKIVESQLQLKEAISDNSNIEDSEEKLTKSTDVALSPDQMIDKMRISWNALVENLKRRLGSTDFDGRQIGNMAWKLADGRRSKPLSNSDADLIQKLHSQYKRFMRLQTSKDEWLTPAVFGSFQRGVEKANEALA